MKFLGVVALLVLQTGVANGTPVAVQSEGHVQNPTWSNDASLQEDFDMYQSCCQCSTTITK